MPTDKNTALRILVRKTQINLNEWIKMIEARRAFIKPHLSSFTLSELGELKCLKCDNIYHKIHDNEPDVISEDESLSLRMQGIFYRQPWDKIAFDYPCSFGFPDGTMQAWGLARSGHWIIAEIRFTGESGYKKRGYERAKMVKIEKTNLTTIISRTEEKPIKIWKKLGESVKEWTKKRKELFEKAVAIEKQIRTEDAALSLITRFLIFD